MGETEKDLIDEQGVVNPQLDTVFLRDGPVEVAFEKAPAWTQRRRRLAPCYHPVVSVCAMYAYRVSTCMCSLACVWFARYAIDAWTSVEHHLTSHSLLSLIWSPKNIHTALQTYRMINLD